jgi:Ca-activated chloride channel family protein
MSFLWSSLLFALVLLPIALAVYVWSLRRRRPSAVRYSSLELIRVAAPGSSRVRRHLPFVLFLAALGALIVGAARPVMIVPVATDQTTIVLTMDVSGSMCSTDIAPTRLGAAESAASNFINGKAASAQIGVVAFSSFAEVVQSPTTDTNQLLSAIGSLAVGRRTAIGEGLLASIDAISQVDPGVAKTTTTDAAAGPGGVAVQPVPKGDYAPDIVVLLTDGANNTGTDPIVAAQQAADRGVRVYTIGFGTADGGSLDPTCASQFLGREPGIGGGIGGGGIGGGGFGGGGFGGGGAGGAGGAGNGGGFRRGIDEATLQQIADMTGGKYYPASSSGDLNAVFASLPLNLIVKHQVSEISVVFVGIGGLLAAGALLLGRAWRPGP